MTTKGQFIEKAAASTTQVNLDGSGFNPEVMPETTAEKTMWQKTSPWVHGLLGAVSSHHMPADVVSPLKHNDGPAIQMDPLDHADTSSNGQNGVLGKKYRAEIEAMLLDKKWREAMLKEVQDIRRVAQSAGTPRKYNEAMLEMLEYFKCLEKNRLLP